MNGKMWLHPATQQNVATLKARGVEFIGPEEGLLSCGYEGLGRLWPVEKVAERALELLRRPGLATDEAPGRCALAPVCWKWRCSVHGGVVMNFGLWQRLRHYSLGDLATAVVRFPGRADRVVEDPGARRRRN